MYSSLPYSETDVENFRFIYIKFKVSIFKFTNRTQNVLRVETDVSKYFFCIPHDSSWFMINMLSWYCRKCRTIYELRKNHTIHSCLDLEFYFCWRRTSFNLTSPCMHAKIYSYFPSSTENPREYLLKTITIVPTRCL